MIVYRYEFTTRNSKDILGRWRTEEVSRRVLDRAFDQKVSEQLEDDHRLYKHGGVSIDPAFREASGRSMGYRDAEGIIASLHRTNGVIDETIKIITHSMGGVYGKGYVSGLKMYIDEHPELKKQVRITLVADFDPYQANQITADPNILTFQFIHAGKGKFTKAGWLANEKEKGLDKERILLNTNGSIDHSIFTFFNDISKLKEGTYTWNGEDWILK